MPRTSVVFPLIKTSSKARGGSIQISYGEKGLIINGVVDGDKANWPKEATDDMATHDHIEMWVSDTENLKLPPIGWGNQFGNFILDNENDCETDSNNLANQSISNTISTVSDSAGCKKWFKDQVKFRKQFQKLFVHQWQLAPGIVRETYASSAYDSFSDGVKRSLKLLQTTNTPSVKISDSVSGDASGQHSYTFQIEIPWDALPPIRSLDLKSMKVLVDVFSPGIGHLQYGPYSSISGNHSYGDTNAFKILKFSQPRQYSITSCGYDLSDNHDIPGPTFSSYAVPYILPGNSLNIDKTLLVDNTIEGYQFNPGSISPTIYEINHFEKNVQPGEIVCGPKLAYIKNSRVLKTDSIINQTSLGVKHISDDEILVKNGPYTSYSYYGSGYCGLCRLGNFSVNYLDFKKLTSVKAYSFESILDANNADFQVSPDWKKITEYDGRFIESTDNLNDTNSYNWSSINHCFNEATYVYDECGTNSNVAPPSPEFFPGRGK